MSDHNLAEALRKAVAELQGAGLKAPCYCVASKHWSDCSFSVRDKVLEECRKALAAHEAEQQDIAALVEGMSVSVDVSTDDATEERRYFGTVTEAMEHPDGRHGLMLLVQDAEPNWDKEAEQRAGEAVAFGVFNERGMLTARRTNDEARDWAFTEHRCGRPDSYAIKPLFTHPQQPLTRELKELEADLNELSDGTFLCPGWDVRRLRAALGITKDTK